MTSDLKNTPERLQRCTEIATQELLGRFDSSAGHWFGALSSSALSTATAVVAMQLVVREAEKRGDTSYELPRMQELIRGGIAWLTQQQNDDGGWGDTDLSVSNISTSMLCHAAFHATESVAIYPEVVARAKQHIDDVGGIQAVIKRYGKDKTFSIPILTMCALAGQAEWKDVSSLPFELACLPASFYKTVRLPVVSYALPALIAIGQVKHFKRPTWFLPWRCVRNLARKRSLRVLERIQPENGGFLEATPLTSFVSMSLAGMGMLDSPVLKKGIGFLIQSVRDDGSWPIDTNLATWVTTMSVTALGESLPAEHVESITKWLLGQQYKTVHPYTNADPGGWSWTDLPGGVPDADDTPGAIIALINLKQRLPDGDPASKAIGEAAGRGLKWLFSLQNRDGGFPTFCRGWGTLPFDRSSNDITAHGIRAMIAYFGKVPRTDVKYRVPPGAINPLFFGQSVRRAFRFLEKNQRLDGSWLPLWFGNQHAPEDENPTYGTTKVLAAYRDAGKLGDPAPQQGIRWLKSQQLSDGGWGSGPGTKSSVEETALAIEALISCGVRGSEVERGLDWLLARVESGEWTKTSPIGFYFAKLWYYEELYPLIFTVSALQTASRSDYNVPGRSAVSVPTTTT